ncbi:MAG: MgtC/SapB family protein [Anaerolineae bacterium]|nr:MgtC/SapB family protein [Anaerolineae bacterium]
MFLAMLLGGAIGFEREMANKPAGLRTHMLVAGSAALITSLGYLLIPEPGAGAASVQVDPIRVIEAVVAGIAFLGAGTIIRQHDAASVEGLTTAASLLMVGAVGIGVALNQFLLAVGATVLVLLTLRVLSRVERRYIK